MKVRPSVKPMCDKCKVIKRNGKVMVICPKYPNHERAIVRRAAGRAHSLKVRLSARHIYTR